MALFGLQSQTYLGQQQLVLVKHSSILRWREVLCHLENYGTKLLKLRGITMKTLNGTKDGMTIAYLYH